MVVVVSNNETISLLRVVTGVGLTKQNGIIHLVIAERTLLPYGQAETTPDHSFYEPWKSSDEFFNVADSNVEENEDYVTLTYENRSINLDMVSFCVLSVNTVQGFDAVHNDFTHIKSLVDIGDCANRCIGNGRSFSCNQNRSHYIGRASDIVRFSNGQIKRPGKQCMDIESELWPNGNFTATPNQPIESFK